MKKLWIVLISLAMVAAFCMPASAVDVKFSGSYYIAGDYYSDLDVVDDGAYKGYTPVSTPGYWQDNGESEPTWVHGSSYSREGYGGDQSTAFFRQRLRIQTEFVVSPGLSLITRFDALEKIWGDQNWTGSRSPYASRPHDNDSNSKEQENIEFEQAYIQYMSKVGMWWIGLAPHDFWGTTFGDSAQTQALVQWILPLNQNWIIGAKYFKSYEGSSSKFNGDRGNDSDDNAYVGVGIFKTQDIEAGLKVAYRRIANFKDGAMVSGAPGGTFPPWLYGADPVIKGWLLTPYFKGQFGPVNVQWELEYWNGDLEDTQYGDIDMEMWATYLEAKVDLGPAYVGGRFVYASGDDPETNDEFEGSNFAPFWEACWGGVDLKQTLILWNEDVTNWTNPNWAMGGPGVKNAFFYQVYGGYKWGDFDFFASVAYAEADETFSGQDDDYGYEADVTASYKITNNLTYMVGAGYLWTGDYFKYNGHTNAGPALFHGEMYGPEEVDVDDIYMITNKLTLTF